MHRILTKFVNDKISYSRDQISTLCAIEVWGVWVFFSVGHCNPQRVIDCWKASTEGLGMYSDLQIYL